MATEHEYMPDSDDEMDTSGDEMDEVTVTLTPQEWKENAGSLYKVSRLPSPAVLSVLRSLPSLQLSVSRFTNSR